MPCSITYHCLHHEDPLFSQFTDILVYIDGLLCLDPLQHVVQGDEGASPAHTSTTVHQQQILPGVGVCLSHSLDEVDHGDGIGRYSMIRPGKVVILDHFKGWSVWFLTLNTKKPSCNYFGGRSRSGSIPVYFH